MSKPATLKKPANPFAQDMKLMKAPDGMGDSISLGGFTIELGDDRLVEVPSQFVPDLTAHGFKPAVAA